MPFEHEGVVVDFIGSGVAERDGAGDVGSAVEILSAAVAEEQPSPTQLGRFVGRWLVVDNSAVAAIAGSHVETLAAIHIALGALGLNHFPSVVFGDSACGSEFLDFLESLYESHAIAKHRIAESIDLHIIFHSLEERNRRFGIHKGTITEGGSHCVAHHIGIDKHSVVVEFGEVVGSAVVRLNLHAESFQIVGNLGCEFGFINKEDFAVVREIEIGNQRGSEKDIVAAQIESPSYLVESGDESGIGAESLSGIEHLGDFACSALAGIFLVVDEDFAVGASRAFSPNLVKRSEIGSETESVLTAEHLETIGGIDREKRAVDGDKCALFEVFGKPFGNGRLSGDILLHHFKAGIDKLHFALEEISGIGPHLALCGSNHGGTVRSIETCEPFERLPVVADILAMVSVEACNDSSVDMVTLHLLAQSHKIFKCVSTHNIYV